MNRILLILATLMILVGLSFAANSDEGANGPNHLRGNPDVKTYQANANNIPEYVEGNLVRPVARGGEAAASISFFEENRGAFRMSDPVGELILRRTEIDELGIRHLLFEQYYNGVRVIGGEMRTHFSSDGALKTVNGNYEADINLPVAPSVDANQAIAIARNDLATFFGEGRPGEAELVIFPWEGKQYLSWRFFLYSDTRLGRWEYFIDAVSGAVIFKANRIMDANDIGDGIGVMGDTLHHIDTHNNGSTYEMSDYTRRINNNPHGHDGQMPSGNYIRTNVAGATLPGTLATDTDNQWFDVSQAPAVSGHMYTGQVYDWLLQALGRNGYDDNGASMLTVVNYSGEGDNNAYWDGSRIVVWSFSTGWRSLAGCPDVIAHEWGHAVTENCSNLIYEKESGALNESFSDMMGAAFEWARDTLDTPDWLMGENGRTSGQAFRSMSDPHQFGDPDYYGTSDSYWIDVVNCTPSYLNDYCGVHTNSGVGNKWYFLLSDGGTHHDVTVTGIGAANGIKVAYRANRYYWNSSSAYADAALGTITAANDLDISGVWGMQTANAWRAVGVAVPGPGLAFSYPLGKPSMMPPDQLQVFEVVVSGTLGGTPVSGTGVLHYSIDGGTYSTSPMTEISSNHYEATLPASACGSKIEYYVSAEEASSGTFYDPEISNPNICVAAASVTTIFSDNFETDKGWTVNGNATAGQWQRGTPAGGGQRGDPPTDYDHTGQCYLTGYGAGDTDVDGGTTNLVSPTFDLTGGDGLIHYARWYSNNFGAAPNADTFKVYISNNNGGSWTLAEKVGPAEQASGGWYVHEFWAGDFITPTNQMKLRFEASDLGSGSVVEAAVDAVVIKVYGCNSSAPYVTTESLSNWTVGLPYSRQLQAAGGTGALTWSDKTGSLAGTGLSLSSAGLLSGTPVAAGPISFTAVVTDENSMTGEKLFSFAINQHITITTATLPPWTAGRPYSQTLAVSGGTTPINWIDKNSSLTGTGLSLSLSGVVSGTPLAAGQIDFIAKATDFAADTQEKAFSLTINAPVQITTTTLPNGTQGKPYSQMLIAAHGTGTISWSDPLNGLSGTGLTLAPNGLVSGTPNAVTTINFTPRAGDIAGSYAEVLLSIVVKPDYLCGDADGDKLVNIRDITFLINFLYKGGAAPNPLEAGDADGNGLRGIQDVTYLINYLYKGGPAPICP